MEDGNISGHKQFNKIKNEKYQECYSQIKAGLAALRIARSQSKQSSYMNTETEQPSLSEHLNQQEFVYIQDFFFNTFTQDKTLTKTVQ